MARSANSWKTTVTGIIQALGVLALTYGVMNEQEVAAWTGVAAAVLGAVLNGLYSRDDNVSSEGRKVNKSLLLLLAVVPAAMIAPGCTSSGSAREYRVAETLYVGAVETATDALAAGTMSLEQARRFEAARAEARAILDQWGELEAGGAGDGYDGWERLESLLDMMIEIQLETHDGRSGATWFDPGRDAGDRDRDQGRRGSTIGWTNYARGARHHPQRSGKSRCRLAIAAQQGGRLT